MTLWQADSLSVTKTFPIVPSYNEHYISYCVASLAIFRHGIKQEDSSAKHNFAIDVIVMDSTYLKEPNEITNGRAQSTVKMEILWTNVFAHVVLHLMGIYGLYVYIESGNLFSWMYGKFKGLIFKDSYIFIFIYLFNYSLHL
jgi:hypothetical protein